MQSRTRRPFPPNRTAPGTAALGAALAVAPLSVGCALGLLLAKRLRRSQQAEAASVLFAVGALATVPLAIDYLKKSINRRAPGPEEQRKLEAIRTGGVVADDEVVGARPEFFVDEGALR